MELIDLVSDLLYKHNCVIIPNFGGFVANFKPADFEENRLLLSPARKKVAFNQSLIENDGLLINALMKRTAKSYEQSEKEVLLFSKFLADRLDKYKNYEFKNLGSFYLNKEGNLIFVAYEGLNFYKKSYGLQDVKIKRLNKAPVKVLTEEVKTDTKTIPLPRQPKRRIVHLPQIAAAVAVIALFGLVLWKMLQTTDLPSNNEVVKNKIVNDSPLQASLLPEITTSDGTNDAFEVTQNEETDSTGMPEIKDVTEDLIKTGQLPQTTETAEITNTNSANHNQELDELYLKAMAPEKVYYVAVVKYRTQAEISQLVSKLQKKEYETFALAENDGTQHLCLEKFLDASLAESFLSLVKKFDDKRAYIITREE